MRQSILSLLVTGLAVLAVRVAHASPAVPAGGTFAIIDVAPAPPRIVGPNLILRQIATYDLAGTLTGTLILHEAIVVPASGAATYHASGTFTGTVDGQLRALRLLAVDTPSPEGRFTILGGTGALARLHGHGTFEFLDLTTGVYAGTIHFGP